MISALNITGSRIPYQMQTLTETDRLPPASPSLPTSKQDNGNDKVSLSTQVNRLEQDQKTRQNDVKQQHNTEIRQLEQEYNQQQKRIEQEFSMKKKALRVNLYA